MDLKEQIKTALGLNTIKLEWQSKMEDGTILVSTADTLEKGVDISVLVEDGTTILLPIGTYKTEDGVSFRVEEEGVVSEVMESESEEVEEEELAEEKEEKEEEEKEDYEEEADVADWKGMEKRIENLEIAVAKLKEDKEGGDEEMEMNEEIVEPSVNPKSIKTTEVKEFSLEELKEENERLKMELGKKSGGEPLVAEKFSTPKVSQILTKRQITNLSSSDRFLYDLNN